MRVIAIPQVSRVDVKNIIPRASLRDRFCLKIESRERALGPYDTLFFILQRERKSVYTALCRWGAADAAHQHQQGGGRRVTKVFLDKIYTK